MAQAVQEGPCGQNDGDAANASAIIRFNGRYPALFPDQGCHLGLLQAEPLLFVKKPLHLLSVEFLIALYARGLNSGPPAAIEKAKLNAGTVCNFSHDAAESINFPHQMPLGDASNGGVARHLRDHPLVEREQSCLGPHPCRCHGCFAAGVPTSNNDDVVVGLSHRE